MATNEQAEALKNVLGFQLFWDDAHDAYDLLIAAGWAPPQETS